MPKETDKYKDERKKVVKYLILILVVLAALNLALLFLNTNKKSTDNITDIEKTVFFKNENTTIVEMNVPAVDNNGNGVSTILVVQSTKGSGKTLVDIENLLFWADTQQSIRMSRFVAGNLTKSNLENYDIIYSIKAKNTSLIGGPSAGAAITIATIFALEGKAPKDNVMITGTINHDGTIGPVSAILEKAKASKQAGANILLVPLLQSSDIIYDTTEHCQDFGANEICSSETVPRKVDVSRESGIEIKEVETINDALRYFE